MCTKAFSPILTRSYSETDISDINDLIKSLARNPKETYVDINNFRILISKVGTFNLCLITNSLSNSIFDTQIMNMIQRHLSSKKLCAEDNISSNIFEIALSFDEVFGNKFVNCTSFESLQTYLAMESKEEELHEALYKVFIFI